MSHGHGEQHAHAEHGVSPDAVDHRQLNRLATSATNHCLTGRDRRGDGMSIATALGWGDVASIALAVALAFLFGYSLTSLPLLRAQLAFTAIVPIALAADTVSIAIMELIDNLTMLLVPGAMEAGLGDARFWLPLLGGFVLAWPFAFTREPGDDPARQGTRSRPRVPQPLRQPLCRRSRSNKAARAGAAKAPAPAAAARR
jgi:hypothetical protein